MSLDTRVRPATLQQMAGNKNTIAAVESLFARRENFPHAILITGPTGCGKTTLGRIIVSMLGVQPDDFEEIDSAQFNGIDTVRDLKNKMRFMPRHPESKARAFLIDECFPAGTKIKTPRGNKKIEQFDKDDDIISLYGLDKVVAIAKKTIPLSKLIKLNFKNKSIITTKEHLFFTELGWIKAENLNNSHLIYLADSYNMNCTNSANSITGEIYGKKIPARMFSMRHCIDWQSKMEQAKVLFQDLFQQIFKSTSRNKSRNAWFGIEKESSYFNQDIPCKHESRNKKEVVRSIFGKNEKEQSITLRKDGSKNKRNKENKWNVKYLARGTWWEREIYRASKNLISCIGVEDGACYSFSGSNAGREEKSIYNCNGDSNELQSGFRKSRFENSNRGGWEWSRDESQYIKRSKENKNTKTERLDYSEIYERGNNDRSFEGVVGDKERDCGFVEMYDLQVKNHPSYFVSDIPVHNCHMLGQGGASEKNMPQNAMLKMLEEAPPHVYFILCTTDPHRLLKTLRGRCANLEVACLDEVTMMGLIKRVARREKTKPSESILESIIEKAQGHPRNAMKLLEKVIGLTEEQAQAVIDEEERLTSEGFELCRALLAPKPSWAKISKILLGLKDQEEEGIRRLVLGYCNSILLKGDNIAAFVVMDEFAEPFYNTGKPGLTLACYKAAMNDERTDIPF